MTKDIFDNDLHDYLNDEEFFCNVCEKPIDKPGVCSDKCYSYDMNY